MAQWKKVAIAALALSLTFGVVTHEAAAKDNKNNKGKQEQKKNEVKKGHKFFKDEDDAKWAFNYIIKMASKGVFIGDTYGNFNPNKSITRAEAIVAAIRLMGLEDEAKALGNVDLNFKDAKEIDRNFRWAENYIYLGLENGLFDAGMDSFQPNKPATREWVATILVRALGLTTEANANMNTKLSFKDAKAISASAVGYVAVAVEKQLVTGYTDGTFQPNKPITRAEMAALLDRMDWINDFELAGIKGTVSNVYADKLQIQRASGETATITIQESTYIILNGKMVTADDIKPGMKVSIVVNDKKETVLIDLKADHVEEVQEWVNGKITSLSLPSGTTQGIIQLTVNNQQVNYYVNENTKVYADGIELAVVDLGVHQNVSFRQKDNTITEIKLVGTVKQVQGVLKQVIAPTKDQVGMLVVTTSTGDTYLPLATNVYYVANGKNIRFDQLTVGSTIEVTTLEQFVKRVNVVEEIVGDVTGFITKVTLPSNNSVGQIEMLVGTESKVYYFTANTSIKSGDLLLHLSDLAAALKVQVKEENLFVNEINVEGTVQKAIGEVTAIQLPTSNQAGTISLATNNKVISYAFAPEFVVSHNGKNDNLSNVEIGDHIQLTTFNGKVKDLKLEEKGTASNRIEGTLVGFTQPTNDRSGEITFLKADNQLVQLTLHHDLKVYDQNGNVILLQDISLPSSLVVEVHDSFVTKITVK